MATTRATSQSNPPVHRSPLLTLFMTPKWGRALASVITTAVDLAEHGQDIAGLVLQIQSGERGDVSILLTPTSAEQFEADSETFSFLEEATLR